VSYPVPGRDELVRLMPQLRTRFPSYAAFGASTLDNILPAEELSKATVLEARDFANSIGLNNGNGTFTLQPMPVEAQFAPIYSSIAGDFDADGHTDLLVAGNFFGVPPLFGRYDASYGTLLHGLGGGKFIPVDMQLTGLHIEGQVRHMAMVRGPKGMKRIAIARNNDTLELLEVRK
jgi:hypothetical protein